MLHRRNWNRYLHLINLGRQLDVCCRHGVSIAWIYTFLVLLLSLPYKHGLSLLAFFFPHFPQAFFFSSFFLLLLFFSAFLSLCFSFGTSSPFCRANYPFSTSQKPNFFFCFFFPLKVPLLSSSFVFFFNLLIYIYLTFYTTQLHHYDHGILLQGTWRRTLEIFFFPVFVLSKICSIIFSLILLQNSHRHCHRHYCYYRRYWLH